MHHVVYLQHVKICIFVISGGVFINLCLISATLCFEKDDCTFPPIDCSSVAIYSRASRRSDFETHLLVKDAERSKIVCDYISIGTYTISNSNQLWM